LVPCISILLSPIAAGADQSSSRTWDFDLKPPGSFQLEIAHGAASDPSDARATYTITAGGETQARELPFAPHRSFVPLTFSDIKTPEHIHVAIAGISETALEQTSVRVVSTDYVDAFEKLDYKEVRAIRAILAAPPDQIDLGRTKLVVDKIIEPATDIDAALAKLDTMAGSVRHMPEWGESGDARVRALRRYLYEPGAWNGGETFRYDLADPLGKKVRNKLLTSYLESREGNCVTMPLLFVVLGQRLGIDLTLATAPHHFLVKFNSDEYRRWINLEATSGGNPARDEWIRKQIPSITDDSLANGIYLRPLTRTETAAEIAETLAEYYYSRHQYEKAIAIANLVLKYSPKGVNAMILDAMAYRWVVRTDYVAKYPVSADIPAADQGRFQYLASTSESLISKAQALGWRPETDAEQGQYLDSVGRARARESKTGN
jgi:regulator of sirC expression with transglutaminase-like and TPR domain